MFLLVTVFLQVTGVHELLKLLKALVRNATRELVSLFKLNNHRLGLRSKQLVDLEVLEVGILRAVEMDRGEVKLRHSLLFIDLVLVKDLHVGEHRTGNSHEEPRHLKDLSLAARQQV